MYRAYDNCPYGIGWHMPLSESNLQQALITWAKTKLKEYPELLWLHHIGNGSKRDSREAMRLKSEGVKAGILDLHLPVARGGYHGAMLELKIPGGKCKSPSPEQADYIKFLTEQGYATIVSNDFGELKSFIVDYLEDRLERHANPEAGNIR